MSANNKIFLAALPSWPALVVAVLWAADPAVRCGALILAAVVPLIGWMLVIALFGSAGSSARDQLSSDPHEREIIDHRAIGRVSAEFAIQITESRSEVLRARHQRQLGMVVIAGGVPVW